MVDVAWAPGAYELPIVAQALARSGRYDAVVCLGCVIRGETTHDRYIALGAATGLMQVSLQTSVPLAFGVLTTQSLEQAEARSGGAHGNKGEDAALAAVEMATLMRKIQSPCPD
jgi:6,7-dimethyl-8-ribityllumazine synthase